MIRQSGLLHYISKLYITIIGNNYDINKLERILTVLPYEIIYCSMDGSCFEFPSLIKMKELADNSTNFYAFYFHTKGASYSKMPDNNNFEWKRVQGTRWRMLMNYFVLYKWNIAINALIDGNDAYGILLRDLPSTHFSGNFWWAKSSIIKSTPKIDNEYIQNRYNAEFWLLDQLDKINLKIYSPFKRGLLLSVRFENKKYKLLPWWHWRNLLFALLGMTIAK